MVLIAYWAFKVKKENDDGSARTLAVSCLKSQYKNIKVRYDVLRPLAAILFSMFLAWSFVPQDVMPPEIIAVLGYVISAVICKVKEIKIRQSIDFKSVLTIASFLFFAEVISQTGILSALAAFLQANISNPKVLVLVIMFITSIVAGVFSAGPAAAGFILSDKVNHAEIPDENNHAISWSVPQYLKYGIQNYVIQLGIAMACMWVIL